MYAMLDEMLMLLYTEIRAVTSGRMHTNTAHLSNQIVVGTYTLPK
jgi:hypothetical protein